jgi:hypothetical protein
MAPAVTAAGPDNDEIVAGPRLREQRPLRLANRDELVHLDVCRHPADRPIETDRDHCAAFLLQDGRLLEASLLFGGEFMCPSLGVEVADVGGVGVLNRSPSMHDVKCGTPAAGLRDRFA